MVLVITIIIGNSKISISSSNNMYLLWLWNTLAHIYEYEIMKFKYKTICYNFSPLSLIYEKLIKSTKARTVGAIKHKHVL